MAKFDPYRKWLGIPPSEQPPDHYRLLGIGLFETDPDVISNAADRQMVHVRTYQSGKYSDISQKLLNELAAARVCLLDKKKRAAYDAKLRKELAAKEAADEADSSAESSSSEESTPAVATAPAIPQVQTSRSSSYSTATRSRSYAARRKKQSPMPAVLSLLGIAVVGVAALAFVLNRDNDDDSSSEVAGGGSQSSERREDPRNSNYGSGIGRSFPDFSETATTDPTAKDPGSEVSPVLPGMDSSSGSSDEEPGEICAYKGHVGIVHEAVLSHDGTFVLTAGDDHILCRWDVETGDAPIRRFSGISAPVLGADVSLGDDQIVAVSGVPDTLADGTAHLWKAGDGQQIARVGLDQQGVAREAKFLPGGASYLLAFSNGVIRIYKTATQELVQEFPGHQGPVYSVACSSDGLKILSGGADGIVRLWNATDGSQVHEMTGHQGAVLAVAFSPDIQLAISGGADGTLRLWDVVTGESHFVMSGHRGPVTSVDISPDARYALSGSTDGKIRLWRLEDGKPVYELAGHEGGVRSVAFSTDGHRAISAGDDGMARLWALPDYSPGVEFPEMSLEGGAGLPVQPLRAERPPADAREKAKNQIQNELFKTEFADSQRDSKQLAERLLAMGRQPQSDPAATYMLLQLAWEEALRAGDVDLAFEAVDELGGRFQVDLLKAKVATFDRLIVSGDEAVRSAALVDKILATSEEATAADDFDTAATLCDRAARVVARWLRDRELASRVRDRDEQIKQLRAKYEMIVPALATLENQPDDPQANQAVGQYYCLVKGDWAKGLPKLAAAADPQWQQLAKADLAGPQDVAGRLAIADGWWDLGEKQSGEAQQQLRRQAASWYEVVLPHLIGVDKARVELRLAEVGGSGPAAGPLPEFSQLNCREEKYREAMLAAFGGNDETEAAVDRALDWLSRHQGSDGHWSFDHNAPLGGIRTSGDPGTAADAPNAATALALLPFLGANNAPRQGKYKANVVKGLNYLRERMAQTGTLYDPNKGMPSQALGTIALCEACTINFDRKAQELAQLSVNVILATQNADGGWAAKPAAPGKTPNASEVYATGWHLEALLAAQRAGLNVNKLKLDKALKYLKGMRTQDKTGYRRDDNRETADATAEAVALLYQMHLGMARDDKQLKDHLTAVGEGKKASAADFYLNYHRAQLLRHAGGPTWEKYGVELRDALLATQATDGDAAGSWYLHSGEGFNKSGGRLLCTVLGALILENYYRHPPIYPVGQ